MKIMLVVPPNSLEERYGKLKNVGALYPSMGLAAIGAVAEERGHEVKILDCEAFGYSYAELENKIKDYRPQIVGMQTYCNTINRCRQIAEQIKTNIAPDIKIVLGGVQATLFPEEYAQDKNIDFIVKGEGELVFENLLKAIENNGDFASVKGLVWKINGRIINNENESLVENLDELPFPSRHLFQPDKYYPSAQIRGKRTFHIITSRGCPFRCGFCSCHKTFGRTYRFMSAARVIREIKYLVEEYRADSLHFYDDTLTIHKGRIMELCELMIKNKLTLPWACFTRVDKVDRELLQAMKRSGCYQIFYGVESGTQRLLDIIDKDITLEQIKNAVQITKEEGIEALGSFIIGLPTETPEESERTIRFAIELDMDFAHCEIFTPHPGTQIFEIALKYGKLTTTDWNKFSTWSEEPVYMPDGRTPDELKKARDKFYIKFYLRPNFLLKRLPNLLKLPPSRIFKLIQNGLSILFY